MDVTLYQVMIRVLFIVVLENCVTTNLLVLQICTANRKKSSIQTLGGDIILNHLHASCYAHVLNLVLHKQTKWIEFVKLLPSIWISHACAFSLARSDPAFNCQWPVLCNSLEEPNWRCPIKMTWAACDF